MQTEQTWRVSSHSGNANSCVELTVGATRTKIRDSKNRDGGVLTVEPTAFNALTKTLRSGTHQPS